MKFSYLSLSALLGTLFLAFAAQAETKSYELTIQDHHFSPAELKVPAGEKIKLRVINKDATPEEFESHDLNREKVIEGSSEGTVLLGPLKAGSYSYVGEYNEDVAKGVIIAE